MGRPDDAPVAIQALFMLQTKLECGLSNRMEVKVPVYLWNILVWQDPKLRYSAPTNCRAEYNV